MAVTRHRPEKIRAVTFRAEGGIIETHNSSELYGAMKCVRTARRHADAVAVLSSNSKFPRSRMGRQIREFVNGVTVFSPVGGESLEDLYAEAVDQSTYAPENNMVVETTHEGTGIARELGCYVVALDTPWSDLRGMRVGTLNGAQDKIVGLADLNIYLELTLRNVY